jgi:hypothetical protein
MTPAPPDGILRDRVHRVQGERHRRGWRAVRKMFPYFQFRR